jgi:phosphatidylglycerol:prolipoprotein diacylglycerol transferase
MLPTILTCGPLTLRAYGLMLATSFIVGMLVSANRARNRGIDPRHVYDLSLVILLSAVIGARLFHFAFHYEAYAVTGEPWLQLLRIWDGGLMLFGGFIFALIGSLVYLRVKKLPLWEITDIIAPAVPLGLGFTRIGCFLNGCCFGRPTDSWLGVVFPNNAPAYSIKTGILPGTPVLPTQLFESAAGFAFFGLLLLVERKWKRFHGLLFGLMVALFGAWRLFIEFYRYREDDMQALGGLLSKNQIISIVITLVGVAIIIWRWLYVRKKGELLDPAAEWKTIAKRSANYRKQRGQSRAKKSGSGK